MAEVPRGHPKVAQRFNVRTRARETTSPEGTAELRVKTGFWPEFSRPFGTGLHLNLVPTLKRWATFGCPLGTSAISLRDSDGVGLPGVAQRLPANH